MALPEYGHRRDFTFPSDELIDGGFFHVVGNGKGVWSPSVSNRYPRFNFAVLRLDPADATVGFDNLIVVNAVPQPGVLALLLAGLGALAATWRRPAART